MALERKLSGQRIAALVADGFEQFELTVPMRALRAAGATVEVVSLHHGKVIGMNLDLPGKRVRVDKTLSEAKADEYDGLLIPGGLIGPDQLRQSHAAREFVRAFDQANKPIASLCHGPWLLISAGLVSGRRVASWPGIRDDVVNAGAIWCDLEVIRDRNWVTSRSPMDFAAFTPAMIDLFAEAAGHAPAPIQAAIAPSQSSPQHTEPPSFFAQGMSWLPRFARLQQSLATIAAGLIAAFAIRAVRRARA